MIDRKWISERWIAGEGIEVGGFHFPFPVVKHKAKVKYIDLLTREQLIQKFPEIKNHADIPSTDIIDDGQFLNSITDSSQDFLLSSHHLEHCEVPLIAVDNHLRVLKSQGILFYAIPNMRRTFDQHREVTPLDHLIDEYEDYYDLVDEGLWENHLREHFNEYFLNVDHLADEKERKKRTELALLEKDNVHFHTWDIQSWTQFVGHVCSRWQVQCELLFPSHHEIFTVLRKL